MASPSSGTGGRGALAPFDPFDPDFRRDPYPRYAQYRREEPVHEGVPPMPSMPHCRYLFRYRDVSGVLHDDRFGRGRGAAAGVGRAGMPTASTVIRRVARRMVLFADPPRHDRLRRAIEAAWSPEITKRVSQHTSQLTHELLTEMLAKPEADLMDDLCVPLPVLVMAEALGVPARHRLRIKRWSTDIVALTDLHEDEAALDAAARATAEVVEYIRELLAHRKKNPSTDLLSGMVGLSGSEYGLDDDEILANAVLLLAAGHETTVGLLGNGLLALMNRPEIVRWLARRPALVPRTVEEMLRFDSPIQMTFRLAQENVVLDDVRIRRGEAVALILGAANRDPAVFPEPNRFRPDRGPNAHLAFGGGRHTCYGAALARREARAALSMALPHMYRFHVQEGVEYAPNFLFRSLRSLPVSIAPAERGEEETLIRPPDPRVPRQASL